MQFKSAENLMTIKTFSPYSNTSLTTSSSDFSLPVSLSQSQPFTLIGELNNLASGAVACINWSNLETGSNYEWYVELYDGQNTTTGPIWSFTTSPGSLAKTNQIDYSKEEIKPGLSHVDYGINIYPNPAHANSFNISMNNVKSGKVYISVFDMNGRLHLKKQYGVTGNIIVNHYLNPGIYVVKIVTDEFTENRKLVIKE